jgi:hypothetical protein
VTPTGNRDLDALFAAAAAPAFPEENDEQVLTVVLAAFNAAGQAECDGDGKAAAAGECRTRPRRSRATVITRCAAMLLVAAGGGVAAASAGILPAAAQSLAHQYLGGIGVPAPNSNGTQQGGVALSPMPTASSTSTHQVPSRARGAATTPAGSATPSPVSSTLLNLCSQVIADGSSWANDLSEQGRTLLAAAAGGDEKIVPYCARISAPTQEPTATPTGGSGSTPSSPSDGSPGDNGSLISASASTDGNPNPNASPSNDGQGDGDGTGGGGANGGRGGNGNGHDGFVTSGYPSPGPTQ